MRCESLHYEAGDDELALPLHHRLTVVAGMGSDGREVLVGDLVAALVAPRAGTRARLVSDGGEPIGSLRDLLTPPPDEATLAGIMRLALPASGFGPARTPFLVQLAAAEPGLPEELADRVQRTSARIAELEEACESSTAYTETIEQIGEQQRVLEEERNRADRLRRLGLGAAGASAILGVLAMVTVGLVGLVLFVAGGAIGAVTLRTGRHVAVTAEQERKAIAAAGADTSLGLQLQRVNAMLQTTRQRRDLLQAAEDHRTAVTAWAALAGPLETSCLRSHADELELLRRIPPGTVTTVETAATLLHMLDRIDGARVSGRDGPRVPAIVDGLLDDLDEHLAIGFLELLTRRSDIGQVVVLTESRALADWARAADGERLRLLMPGAARV